MEKFFAWPPRPDRGFTRGEVTRWWGARRGRYNGYVLSASVLAFSIYALFDGRIDFSDWEDWLGTVLLFLIGANVCYTFGWIIDAIVYRSKPTRWLYQAGVIFSVVLALFPAAWSVGTFFGGRNAHRVGQAIEKEIKRGASQVDMAQLARFEWDEMFVFGPYAPKEWICNDDLKISEWQCSAAGIGNVGESEDLIVFMNKGKVADAETIPRYFDESEHCMRRREEAKFTVMRNPGASLVCK